MSDDWKPGPAPSWDDLWNANSRLRAALAEAEREIERFREVCKGKTECLHDAYKQRDAARASLAEAERERDLLERRQDDTQGVLMQTGNMLVQTGRLLAEEEREKQSIRDTCVALDKHNDALEAELAASMIVRAELEHRLTNQSEDKLRAENLRLTEESDRLRAALADAEWERDRWKDAAGGIENRAKRAEADLADAGGVIERMKSVLGEARSQYIPGSPDDYEWDHQRDLCWSDARAFLERAKTGGDSEDE